MNLCISILNESFALIKIIQREIGSKYMFDWELNQHFWNQLLSFFHLKQNAETRKKGSLPIVKDDGLPNTLDKLSKQMEKILDFAITHYRAENNTIDLKSLTIWQGRHVLKKFEENKTKIEFISENQVSNMLRVKKVKNDNHTWTYWYYYFDEYDPLLKIAFLCADENPGEIICQYMDEDMLSNTQNKPCSYTLGPTITITSNSLQETKKNEFEIVYFCPKTLHHYYCCELLQSFDGTTWHRNPLQQMSQPGVEEHLLQDIIYVETLPAYLSLVRRPRREYLCWDNKNGEKISLLEPTLSICLSPRDIYRNKYSAILKLEFEDDSCSPTVVLTLNAEVADPIIFRFQETNQAENLALQLYTKTSSEYVKDKILFQSKLQANQETSHMLKPSLIKSVWRNKIKCLKDPLFLDLSQIENKWKEPDKNDGIPSQPDLLHPERKLPDMNASKIQLFKSVLSVMEEGFTHVDNTAEKYKK